MAQQPSTFYFASQGSKPLPHLTENMSCVPRNPGRASIPCGGAEMEWNSSNQSNSTISSDGNYMSSSSTDSMEFEEPIGQYDWIGSEPQPRSSAAALPSAQPHPECCQHATPTGLGWSPETQLWKLYKFMVPKGTEPYLKLLPKWTVTDETPPMVFLDPPKIVAYKTKGSKAQAYPCQFPGGCPRNEEPFTRPADLERHYKHVHAQPNKDECYHCDYPKCQRSTDPFTRKDHFRDHLKDYHKEDIGSAKGEKQTRDRKKWLQMQEQWLGERLIYPIWWRCHHCLLRVHVAQEGWQCPECKTLCEPERKKARLALEQQSTSSTATPAGPTCSNCNGSAWVEDMAEWVACPSCQSAFELPDYDGTEWPTTNPYSNNWSSSWNAGSQ